jgi:hypothetical protein
MSDTEGIQEIALRVLLSEKEHADRQISGYLELQLKLIAFIFGAAGAVLSLAFAKLADRPSASELGYICAFLSVGSSLVSLQSTITYGIALNYIRYKQRDIMPDLRAMSGFDSHSLNAVAGFIDGPSRIPVLYATAAVSALHPLASLGLLVYGAERMCPSLAKAATLTFGAVAFLCSLAGSVVLAQAMKKVSDGQ